MKESNTVGKPEPHLRHFRSYILRFWPTDPDGAGGWQASLEDTETGRRMGFASLEELFFFLLEQTGESSEQAT